MEKSIYSYVLKHSSKDQVYLIIMTAMSLPLVYFGLDIPRIIVNRAIEGKDLPAIVFGMEFEQIPFLLLLSFAYLVLVFINGGFKYVINVYRGVLGERMLRRFRYELYSRILRFPLPHFKRMSAGEIIPMVTAETEPLGGFIGDAFALPAFQGGILLTYIAFIMVQDPILGVAAVALYPLQMVIIPRLQRKVNVLAKRRVQTVRKVADRIGEAVSGVTEIHAHDTSQFERADMSDRLGTILDIRIELFKRKYFIKFLNNFLASVTPFFFYSAGGYLVIVGDLTLGSLVAVLAAYKGMSPPWKELLKYYQMKEDIRIKYEQIIDQFQPADMLDPELLDAEAPKDKPLAGEMVATNLSLSEDGIVKEIDGASFRIDLGKHTAIVGPGGSGKDELARLISRLVMPTSGQIRVGDDNLSAIPEAVLGRRMTYVGPNAFTFSGSVRDNLYYGLKHRPLKDAEYDEAGTTERERLQRTAELSGNSLHDIQADWIDYAAAGVADMAELNDKALDILALVEMGDDIYQLGLRSRIDPEAQGELAAKLLEARAQLRERLAKADMAALIEPFDETKYNTNASVAENLLFGTPTTTEFDIEHLADNAYVTEVLNKAGLYIDLLEIGRQVAKTMVELFADLPPDHEFFEQYSFISSDDLPEFQSLLTRIANVAAKDLAAGDVQAEDRARLLSLAFKIVTARHRLGIIDEKMRARLLKARQMFASGLPQDLAHMVAFFSAEAYNAEATIQDNILFGKLAYGQAQAQASIGNLIAEVVDGLELRRKIMHVGMNYEVGIAGGRLSISQRQKLAIARGLLKESDVLVLNEATGPLDATAEDRILAHIVEHMKGRGLIWVLDRVGLARHFDRVLVMDSGKVEAQGTYAELEKTGTTFKALQQVQ